MAPPSGSSGTSVTTSPASFAKNRALFYFAATVTSVVPIYLFYATKEVPASIALVFLLVVGVSVAYLPEAYQILFEVTEKKLDAYKISDSTKSGRVLSKAAAIAASKDEKEKDTRLRILKRQIALARALWQCNLTYLATILLCNFYFFKNFDVFVNFLLGGLLATLISYYLATQSAKPPKKTRVR